MTESFHPMKFKSKMSNITASIFSTMSALATEHEAINLAQGFPDFATDPRLIELVSKYMRDGYNQYAPMPGYISLREKIAAKYQLCYGVDLNPAGEITITAGGTQALSTVISTVVSPGDEVIIFEPAYDSYRPSVELLGGKVVSIALMAPDFEIDWALVRQKINDNTKLIIINNPNNPTGRVLTLEDIRELESIVCENDLLLLSDEVYEHIIYDGQAHLTVLSSARLRDRSFVVCSFGKLLHTTGWKIGYVVASPLLTGEFRKIHQFNTFAVHAPTQLAIAAYLEDEAYYHALPKFFEAKRDFLVQALASSRWKVLPTQGTYFMLLDYTMIAEEEDQYFARQLTEIHKVAMIPVSSFYTNETSQKLLRICFAKKQETLSAAAAILLEI